MFFVLIILGLGKDELSSPAISICGLASGIFASLLTHPADVVKTSIQASSEPYKNIATVKNIFKVTDFKLTKNVSHMLYCIDIDHQKVNITLN